MSAMRAHEAGALHADAVSPPSGPPPAPDDADALAPGVWPGSLSRDPSTGALRLAGHDVRDLAELHGTPAYLLDEADLRGRARAWRDAFSQGSDDTGRPSVYYAGKAFLCTALAQWVAEEGLGVDVCTVGELETALRAGVEPSRLLMHGNNKGRDELDRAVDVGVGTIVVDSFDEIVRLAASATARDAVADVLVRVTVGVEAHTHEFIATAHEDQKFGFSLSGGSAAEAVRRILALPSLRLVGLHSHIGSQIFDTSGFEVAAHRVVSLLADIRDEHGVELPVLDLGGGLGIAYTATDDPQTPADIAAALLDIVRRECESTGLAVPSVCVEPGRAIAGPPTITLYEVGTVKPVDLDGGLRRTYVSVDGGMSDNIRTALYDAAYTTVLASRASSAPPMLSRVVGKHCESGDVVVKDAWLPSDLVPGDLLAVAATGAYGRSMASNYNHVPRPPVIAVRPDGTRPIVRRETIDDLLALDVADPATDPWRTA
jgi:diaminopimelate decarboxylase